MMAAAPARPARRASLTTGRSSPKASLPSSRASSQMIAAKPIVVDDQHVHSRDRPTRASPAACHSSTAARTATADAASPSPRPSRNAIAAGMSYANGTLLLYSKAEPATSALQKQSDVEAAQPLRLLGRTRRGPKSAALRPDAQALKACAYSLFTTLQLPCCGGKERLATAGDLRIMSGRGPVV